MNKLLLFSFAGLVSLTSLVKADEVAALKERVKKLEERLDRLEKGSSEKIETKNESGKSLLKLKDWSYTTKKRDFSEYYSITYKLENKFKKDIKLIDGSIRFSDLLGESLYGIRLEKDKLIKAGAEQSNSGDYSINEFISSQLRMKKMKKEDITAKLVIRRIVFADNTILKVEQ